MQKIRSHFVCGFIVVKKAHAMEYKCEMDSTNQEMALCEKLRSICKNNKEEKPKESAKIFHKLAQVYRSRSPDKIALIRSAVLFNAALVRKPDNVGEIRKDLHKLCSHVLELADAKQKKADLVQESGAIFAKVKKMRSHVDMVLKKLELSPKSKEAFENHSNKKVKMMEDLQNTIANDFTTIMKVITELCISIKGTLPCKYALVGMGSLARKEITPNSDFENIIILEDGIEKQGNYEEILEYFRWVAVIFQLIIVNLGETIVAVMDFPYLNNYKEEKYNWYYDAITPRGLSFDGLVPFACKSALGREPTENKPWKTELIKPVSKMLEYLQSDEDLKNGYHLADMLTKTCFVAGDKKMYDAFDEGSWMFMKDPAEMSQRMLKIHNPDLSYVNFSKQLEEDLENFGAMQKSAQTRTEGLINIKRKIYRPITLFVTALSRHYKIKTKSSFDQVRELHRLGEISESFCKKLLFALSIACEVRLKVYSEKQGQKDDLKQNLTTENGVKVTSIERMIGHISYIEFAKTVIHVQRIAMREVRNMTIITERVLFPFMLPFWFSDVLDDQLSSSTFVQIYNKLSEQHRHAFNYLTYGHLGHFLFLDSTPAPHTNIPKAKQNVYTFFSQGADVPIFDAPDEKDLQNIENELVFR